MKAGRKTGHCGLLAVQNKGYAEPYGSCLGVWKRWTKASTEGGPRIGHGPPETAQMSGRRTFQGTQGVVGAAEKTQKGIGWGTADEGKEN